MGTVSRVLSNLYSHTVNSNPTQRGKRQMGVAEIPVLPAQLALFGDSTCSMARKTTAGGCLSRQQLRVHVLMNLQGLDACDVSAMMGIHQSHVYRLQRDGLAKMTERGVAWTPHAQSDRVDTEVRMGWRCQTCHLLLPCRTDGMEGPCDAREKHQIEACLELLSYTFGNGKASKDVRTNGQQVWKGQDDETGQDDDK